MIPFLLPPQSPSLNAYAERFGRSIKKECLDQLIFFSERSLHHALTQYIEHYHEGRPHQGINNRPIEPRLVESWPAVTPECRERLGGLLHSYEQRVA